MGETLLVSRKVAKQILGVGETTMRKMISCGLLHPVTSERGTRKRRRIRGWYKRREIELLGQPGESNAIRRT
jgi:hypothetical protein